MRGIETDADLRQLFGTLFARACMCTCDVRAYDQRHKRRQIRNEDTFVNADNAKDPVERTKVVGS